MNVPAIIAAAFALVAAMPIASAGAAEQPLPAPATSYTLPAGGYRSQAVAVDPSPVWSAPGEAPHYVLYGHYVGGGKWRQEWVLAP